MDGVVWLRDYVTAIRAGRIHPFTVVERKARSATRNEPWGPTGTMLAELAELSNDPQHLQVIFAVLDYRIRSAEHKWRCVYKALQVLEFLLKRGSPQCLAAAGELLVPLAALSNFQHVGADGRDYGLNVRVRAEAVKAAILDAEGLAQQRAALAARAGAGAMRFGGYSRADMAAAGGAGGGGAGGGEAAAQGGGDGGAEACRQQQLFVAPAGRLPSPPSGPRGAGESKGVTFEQNKRQLEALRQLTMAEGNRVCADCASGCAAARPTWASINLGVFVCMRCAGIHRGLGVHVSKVRSTTLDTWLPEQVALMARLGNKRANAFFEATLTPAMRPPRDCTPELERFIRLKYADRVWAAKGTWPPPEDLLAAAAAAAGGAPTASPSSGGGGPAHATAAASPAPAAPHRPSHHHAWSHPLPTASPSHPGSIASPPAPPMSDWAAFPPPPHAPSPPPSGPGSVPAAAAAPTTAGPTGLFGDAPPPWAVPAPAASTSASAAAAASGASTPGPGHAGARTGVFRLLPPPPAPGPGGPGPGPIVPWRVPAGPGGSGGGGNGGALLLDLDSDTGEDEGTEEGDGSGGGAPRSGQGDALWDLLDPSLDVMAWLDRTEGGRGAQGPGPAGPTPGPMPGHQPQPQPHTAPRPHVPGSATTPAAPAWAPQYTPSAISAPHAAIPLSTPHGGTPLGPAQAQPGPQQLFAGHHPAVAGVTGASVIVTSEYPVYDMMTPMPTGSAVTSISSFGSSAFGTSPQPPAANPAAATAGYLGAVHASPYTHGASALPYMGSPYGTPAAAAVPHHHGHTVSAPPRNFAQQPYGAATPAAANGPSSAAAGVTPAGGAPPLRGGGMGMRAGAPGPGSTPGPGSGSGQAGAQDLDHLLAEQLAGLGSSLAGGGKAGPGGASWLPTAGAAARLQPSASARRLGGPVNR
ncbi:hypothetical protein HYH03_010899 [Edaphochlamys debaryana]|uniref:Uncharacterized protein n=1 Tax=Edaphochlamys debaryana TaxID=47281 RepID=A0A835Y495_9CHLO|nr:hypothetical protein HYH03_010899 [Edaphochlamys debaryana]|eukprot:KAG2490744.1 hypothetical protein HYH03_010899 [Edaphochlamys debaryana]